jgi:hypothetical protein
MEPLSEMKLKFCAFRNSVFVNIRVQFQTLDASSPLKQPPYTLERRPKAVLKKGKMSAGNVVVQTIVRHVSGTAIQAQKWLDLWLMFRLPFLRENCFKT